jgi:hypothetical protein
MKRFFYPIILAFITLISTTLSASNPADWETYFKNDTVKIEYAYQNCEFSSTAKQEVIAFRFTNLINQTINLNYTTELWNNDQCLNCNQETKEHQKSLTLSSNEIITANCNGEWKGLVIFSAFITNDNEAKRHESITKFELTEINISHE